RARATRPTPPLGYRARVTRYLSVSKRKRLQNYFCNPLELLRERCVLAGEGETMRTVLIFLVVPAAVALAQENPLSAFNKRAYGQVKSWILTSAEKMPESNYSFRPVDEVRSFGQIIGHAADAQFFFCSVMLGEKLQPRNIEKTKTAKADLIAGLKEAATYCDRAYDTMTDAAGTQMVKFGA